MRDEAEPRPANRPSLATLSRPAGHTRDQPKARVRDLLRSLSSPMFEWSETFDLVDWNGPARRLFGFRSDEAEDPGFFNRLFQPAAQHHALDVRSALESGHHLIAVVHPAAMADGRELQCEWNHVRLIGDAGDVIGFASWARELPTTVERTARVNTSIDVLTGLPDLQSFGEWLRVATSGLVSGGGQLALLCVGVDRLTDFNTTFGRRAGDQALRRVAAVLKGAVRGKDAVGRIGGDRFIIALLDVDGRQGAEAVARRIGRDIGQAFSIEGRTCSVTASIGIDLFEDGRSDEVVLEHAQSALNRAKLSGRDRYSFYSENSAANTGSVGLTATQLEDGLVNGEFDVLFQPLIALRGDKLVGAEALLRWQHPQRGALAPSEFLPLAEETGLMIPIGSWVLRIACATMQGWEKAGLTGLRVAVNVAGCQLRRTFVDELASMICSFNFDPDALVLELNETATMSAIEAQPGLLHALKSMGLHISVDGVGSGGSSLGALARIPVDVLKIDNPYVRNCISEKTSAAIVEAIIAIGHASRLQVIGAGVETKEQAAFLRDHGCDAAQGFYFGRPMGSDDFLRFATSGPYKSLRSRTDG